MKKLFVTASALALMISPAFATTYVGTRTVGTGSANLSITTDGTTGGLVQSNVTDWTIILTNTAGIFTLHGPLSGSNSQFLLTGNGLSATATDLLFDFGASSSFGLFQNPGIGSGQNWYCFESLGANCAGSGVGESVTTIGGSRTNVFQQGNVVLASVDGGGAVPEPASWALMLAGFGLAGGALRVRRRSVAVSYA